MSTEKNSDKKAACPCASGASYEKCCMSLDIADALKAKGRYSAAITNYRQAIALKPNSFVAHNNLGESLAASGKHEEALACYRKALSIKPDFDTAFKNIWTSLKAQNSFAELLVSCQRALSIKPDFAEACFNLGIALEFQGNLVAAINAYRKAIALNPDFSKVYFRELADSYVKLALFFESQARLPDAIECYQQAILLNPKLVVAYYNLGVTLRFQGRFLDAITYYRQAITLSPDYLDAYHALGEALQQTDSNDEAVVCYEQAYSRNPKHPEFLLQKIAVRIPALVYDNAEITSLREAILRDIDFALAQKGTVKDLEQAQFHLFNLAYHGVEDRALIEKVATLVRAKAPALSASLAKKESQLCADGKIHIGFLSNFFYDHTIGKLTFGYIRNLDRTKFHVTVIHAPDARQDKFREAINAAADQVVILPSGFIEAQRQVAALSLDVLHYPDIGMSSYTYLLAYARLAPIQTVAWGHPITTGLESIDYYLSFNATEPDGADDQYTEMLVRLSRAPYCDPEVIPENIPDRAAAGLPVEGALYGCVQSLFKIHPDFDAVLADIIVRDPQGWIIAFEGSSPHWTHQIRQRWAKNFPILVDKVIFIPRQPFSEYLKLVANFDLMLDTLHFGSGMTFYQSLVLGIPTITWPGKFMRGRFVSGIYRWLGIDDAPIVEDLNDYGRQAVALANDLQRRDAFKQQFSQKITNLYNDELAIREMELFFEQAIIARKSGQKLVNWSSGISWPAQQKSV